MSALLGDSGVSVFNFLCRDKKSGRSFFFVSRDGYGNNFFSPLCREYGEENRGQLVGGLSCFSLSQRNSSSKDPWSSPPLTHATLLWSRLFPTAWPVASPLSSPSRPLCFCVCRSPHFPPSCLTNTVLREKRERKEGM